MEFWQRANLSIFRIANKHNCCSLGEHSHQTLSYVQHAQTLAMVRPSNGDTLLRASGNNDDALCTPANSDDALLSAPANGDDTYATERTCSRQRAIQCTYWKRCRAHLLTATTHHALTTLARNDDDAHSHTRTHPHRLESSTHHTHHYILLP